MAVQDPPRLSRRQFAVGLVAGSAAALVACKKTSRRPVDALDAGQFLALSRALLRPAEPDPALAEPFLQALRATERPYSLVQLAADVGQSPDPDVETLIARLPHAEARKLADEVIAAWYTGVVSTAAGPVFVTWSGALAWRVIPGINAPSECGGGPGSWANAPGDNNGRGNDRG